MTYTIQLPTFEGPLDLLLRLIERAELDITTIALARVADQYLEHVRAMTDPDPRALSEFLVLAARLLLIKSRALLPRPVVATGGATEFSGDDSAEELAEQLRAYQQYKQAATLLRNWEEQGRRLFVRTAPPPVPAPPTEQPLDVSVDALVTALQRRIQLLLEHNEPDAPLALPRRLTVREAAERVRERLAHQTWFSFEDLLSLVTTRQEVIVMLWAVLELLKRRAVTVEQPDLFGSIAVGRGSAFERPLEPLDEDGE